MKKLPKVKLDGAVYDVAWDEFERGDSMFFICLNRSAAEQKLKRIAASLLFEVATQQKIEDGIRGVRMWRL